MRAGLPVGTRLVASAHVAATRRPTATAVAKRNSLPPRKVAGWLRQSGLLDRLRGPLAPLALALGALALCAACFAAPSAPQAGTKLPALALCDVSGRPFALSQVTEPVLVLNFWAFWCDTWKAELPQLLELAPLQETLQFRLIAVSVDGSWTDLFWQTCGTAGVPFPVLLDQRRALSTALGIRKVPTVMVMDARRRVRWVSEAYPGNTKVLAAIRQVASQP